MSKQVKMYVNISKIDELCKIYLGESRNILYNAYNFLFDITKSIRSEWLLYGAKMSSPIAMILTIEDFTNFIAYLEDNSIYSSYKIDLIHHMIIEKKAINMSEIYSQFKKERFFKDYFVSNLDEDIISSAGISNVMRAFNISKEDIDDENSPIFMEVYSERIDDVWRSMVVHQHWDDQYAEYLFKKRAERVALKRSTVKCSFENPKQSMTEDQRKTFKIIHNADKYTSIDDFMQYYNDDRTDAIHNLCSIIDSNGYIKTRLN